MNRQSGKEKRLRKSRETSKVREGGTNWPQGPDPCAAQGTMLEEITLQPVEAEQVTILEETMAQDARLDMIFPVGLQHTNASMAEQGKTVRKREQQRRPVTD